MLQGGTGLGLSISKRIIESTGGNIGFESEEGQGAKFKFIIPVERPSHNEESNRFIMMEEKVRQFNIYNERTAIVIEPNESQLKALCNKLESFGMKCTGFSTSEAAINASTQRFSTVIMDGEMPRTEVEAVINTWRSARILISEKLTPGVPSQFSNLPVTVTTIRKPIRIRHLLNIMYQDISQGKVEEKNQVTKIDDKILSELKVMVAEDNSVNQRVIKRMLERFNIDATIVDDGKKAVEEAKRRKYDLILMDCNMPVMVSRHIPFILYFGK